ncbi:MAG: Hsp70 family protein [Negativicutes bacterium]|nr:Hsp70 family protein [Negativicutes bacterium]
MFDFWKPENKYLEIEKKIKKASISSDPAAMVSIFSDGFFYFLRLKRYDLLSNFILAHLAEIQDKVSLSQRINRQIIKQQSTALQSEGYAAAALILCDSFGLLTDTLTFLAEKGQANEIALRLAKEEKLDKEIVGNAVTQWEKYNGDLTKSPTMSEVIRKIGLYAPEYLPSNPRVQELIGQLKEAACLYEQEGDVKQAARCYESSGQYAEACRIYTDIRDREGISRTAEALGDLRKALEFTGQAERKLSLLLRLEQFASARAYASGMENPQAAFSLIRAKAKSLLLSKMQGFQFIEAMDLAGFAECGSLEKDEILTSGRRYYDQLLTAAKNGNEIREIYQKRILLEEKAGKYAEAGCLAEEVLHDLELASLYYEKANLFHRAIEATAAAGEKRNSDYSMEIRLAELHERGGNLLSAAQLYAKAARFDQAYRLYNKLENYTEAIQCYRKTASPDWHVLADLSLKTGDYEQAIERYLASTDFSDLENAMSIAQKYHLPDQIKQIEEAMAKQLRGTAVDLQKWFAAAKEIVAASYTPVLGIDFGTSNSTAAIFQKKIKKLQVIPVPGTPDRSFEPSFFGVDENNKPIFGEKARLRSLTAPECVAARIKRSIGGGGSFTVGKKKYKSEEIAAMIIQRLKLNAELYLRGQIELEFRQALQKENLRFPEEKILEFLQEQEFITLSNVVLTVPAFYNNNQKRATRDAAEITGLKVLRLLHEPTAAALAYGYQKAYTGTLAVIDLGGGTLDISVLEVCDGVYEVMNIFGDTKLGGSDIDAALLRFAITDIREKLQIELSAANQPIEINRLLDGCENLKINLSTLETYTLQLPYFLNQPSYALTLTRKELEQIASPFLLRLKKTIEQAVKEYRTVIRQFLLVGNASKMPAVLQTVKSVLQAEQLVGMDPGTVVAMGAALTGAILWQDVEETLLLDMVPYSLGISVLKQGDQTEEEEMSCLIQRNTTIPAKHLQEYTTVRDNQTEVNIKIYQGESAEPGQNYFLGNFKLDGILPAPAGTAKILVEFDIGSDCILKVSAEDKKTRKKQSIRLDGAVTLSPLEKAALEKHFAESEDQAAIETKLEQTSNEFENLLAVFRRTAAAAEQDSRIFAGLFHEKIEVNARLYRATAKQVSLIQEIFTEREQLPYLLQKYQDEAATIEKNFRQLSAKHSDFSDQEILPQLRERLTMLTGFRLSIQQTTDALEMKFCRVMRQWIQLLQALEPDLDKMSPEKIANAYLVDGRCRQAKEILESLAASPAGLTETAFELLLKCCSRLYQREEYVQVHRKYGRSFQRVYPDFNRLDAFLKNVSDSVFMIQTDSLQKTLSGSGFSIAPHFIVTNRHVLEGTKRQDIRIFANNKMLTVSGIELDPSNDLAILEVEENLTPFRIGEFQFVEPGEQILALGFPSPTSNSISENIYISRGIVNSIRHTAISAERVIFIDAKIGKGMSGGPLINDLGEVIGIITLIQYNLQQLDQGLFTAEQQPIALPIHLIRNDFSKYKVAE